MTVNAVRPDNRLEDSPMVPVTCADCAVGVLVRKSSWDQTSVQWKRDEAQLCFERQAADDGRQFRGCSNLMSSVEQAARTGSIPVVQDELGIPKSAEAAEAARR